MKKITLTLLIVMLITSVFAQQIILFEKNTNPGKSEEVTNRNDAKIKQIEDSIKIYSQNIEKAKVLETIPDTTKDSERKKALTKDLEKLEKQNPAENKFLPPRATFFAMAVGTGTEDASTDLLSNITTSGRLSAQINLLENRRLFTGISGNLSRATNVTPEEKDSVDFNSLMFPQSGNFGFIFSPGYTLLKQKKTDGNYYHTLDFTAEFAFRNVKIDSPSIGFSVLNYNLGFRWNFQYRPDDDNVIGLSVMPYFNYFNVPDEDVKQFTEFVNDSLFSSTTKGGGIPSIGGKLSLQYNTVNFFFDIRQNFNSKDFDDSNPFKGTMVNIGIATAINLKSWKD